MGKQIREMTDVEFDEYIKKIHSDIETLSRDFDILEQQLDESWRTLDLLNKRVAGR